MSFIGKTIQESIDFAVKHLIEIGKKKDKFTIALSGGSTPKAIYQALAASHRDSLDWTKAFIFFSDERCVPPTSDESNYKMAITNGIGSLGIPENQIFRMKGELDPVQAALEYQNLINQHVPQHQFDLIMLGVGDDGHTASLFPDTAALNDTTDLVASNWVPKLNTHRITFTFPLINAADHIHVYILGQNKAPIVKEIFTTTDLFPIQRVDRKKSLYILDEGSASLIK